MGEGAAEREVMLDGIPPDFLTVADRLQPARAEVRFMTAEPPTTIKAPTRPDGFTCELFLVLTGTNSESDKIVFALVGRRAS